MHRPLIAALTLLFLLSQIISCQEDPTGSNIVSGIIVDDSTGKVLPFVHLWNEQSKVGSVSDETGMFRMNAKSQDTLTFSALGYFGKSIIVRYSFHADDLVIRLKPKKYEIHEVVVRRWSSYAAFKHDFLNLELPDSKIEPLKAHLKLSATAAALEADGERAARDKMDRFGLTSSMGPGINRDKERQKELERISIRQKIIRVKFNRKLVGDLTKLEGDELTKFIASCNFSDEYLYNNDLRTIIEALYAKFEAYQYESDTLSSVQ